MVAREAAIRVLEVTDEKFVQRTWEQVIADVVDCPNETTKERRLREFRAERYDRIRGLRLLNTHWEDFKRVIKKGGVATNLHLKLLHNRALERGWLSKPLIERRSWPKPEKSVKRAITLTEHTRIIEGEGNTERRLFYEILWYSGMSQSDAAKLMSENINLAKNALHYERSKTRVLAVMKVPRAMLEILSQLPSSGHLFPSISKSSANARAAEFNRRCRLLGIRGISLHSYRYAWTERAAEKGYPLRHAMTALGHTSKAVHLAYAKNASFLPPAMEDYQTV